MPVRGAPAPCHPPLNEASHGQIVRPRNGARLCSEGVPAHSPAQRRDGSVTPLPRGGMRRRGVAIAVSLLWTIVILVVANAATIAAMLLVRRRAPEGSYFKDGDRASGVFGVLAGGFAIFAGFIIFLAFTTYDQSRSGGEAEAITVVQQFETAEFLPATVRAAAQRASSSATARSVVHQEWPQMEDGRGRRQRSTRGRSRCSGACSSRTRQLRPRRPRTGSGSTRPRTARRAGATGSTARRASSRPRSGSSCS